MPNINNLFDNTPLEVGSGTMLDQLHDRTMLHLGNTHTPESVEKVLFSLESSSPEMLHSGKKFLTDTHERLKQLTDEVVMSIETASLETDFSLNNMSEGDGTPFTYTNAQLQAAAIGAGLTHNIKRSSLATPDAVPTVGLETAAFTGMSETTNVSLSRSTELKNIASLEAYNETETQVAESYTIQYNLHAPAQDALSQAFFQPNIISPNSIGYVITAPVHFVQDDKLHETDGTPFDSNRRNLLRAGSDMHLLESNVTEMIPVYKESTKDYFAPEDVVEPKLRDVTNQEPVMTSFLKPGRRMGYISLCATDHMLGEGKPDITHDVDPGSLALNSVLCKIGDDAIIFPVKDMPFSNFTHTTQGESREMALSFETANLTIHKDTKGVGNAALTSLSAVVDNDLKVRVMMIVDGKFNVETGNHIITSIIVELGSVVGPDGEVLAKDSATFKAIETLFQTCESYYKINANRTLANKSARGRLLGSTQFAVRYNVPFREPLTILHPVDSDDKTDTSDLATLIEGTHVEANANAARALLNRSDLLHRTVGVEDHQVVNPQAFGISDLLINRAYIRQEYHLPDIVDSRSSGDLVRDTREAIVNILRETLYRLVEESEIEYVASRLNGGAPVKLVPKIATSYNLSQYMMIEGDFRTLGPQFAKPVIADVLYPEFKDRVIMCIDVPSNSKDLNPLKPGTFSFAPETTSILPIKRNGVTNREVCVQPRFTHVMDTVVMADLSITGVESAMLTKMLNYSTDPTVEDPATTTP